MTGYYAAAFKTGAWPRITADKIFIWGRPHGVNDNASDGLGKPQRYDWVTPSPCALSRLAADFGTPHF